jgi:RHS repeat-associated protein
MTLTGAPGAADVATGEFGYAGGYRSVGGMYHFGQRFYDPAVMRWTQMDPLDQIGDLREGNRYSYAGGDPVGSSDPDGLARVTKSLWPPDMDVYFNKTESKDIAAGLAIGGSLLGLAGGPYTAAAIGISGIVMGRMIDCGFCLAVDLDPLPGPRGMGNPEGRFYRC